MFFFFQLQTLPEVIEIFCNFTARVRIEMTLCRNDRCPSVDMASSFLEE